MTKPKGGKSAGPKKQATPKAPRKNPKTSAAAPGSDALATVGHNSERASRLTPAEEAELFGRHRASWNRWKGKEKEVEKLGIEVKAALKADGFKVAHFKIADDLTTVKGEKRVVDDVTDRLKVARWIGHALGNQYDLFEQKQKAQPARVDWRAEGRIASQNNQPRKPPSELAPDTDSYRAWMDGYNDHQEELANRVGRAAGNGGVTSKDGEPVTSGTAVPRSEFQKGLAENAAKGEQAIKEFNEQQPTPGTTVN